MCLFTYTYICMFYQNSGIPGEISAKFNAHIIYYLKKKKLRGDNILKFDF